MRLPEDRHFTGIPHTASLYQFIDIEISKSQWLANVYAQRKNKVKVPRNCVATESRMFSQKYPGFFFCG